MKELLDLKVDVVFKDFFGDRNSKDVIESFINSVLSLEGENRIEVEEFLDPRQRRVEVGRPSTFVDLIVKSLKGERFIIEMQTYNHRGFDKRLLYYLGKDYTEQIDYRIEESPKRTKKQINYSDLPKVHIIAVVDFHRSSQDEDGILNGDKVVETYHFTPKYSPLNDHLFDQWSATILDLKKFDSTPLEELKTDQEIWFYIFKNASVIQEEEINTLKKRPVFKHAIEKLERLSSDPATRKAYEDSVNEHRDHLAVLSASIEEGIKEGEKRGLQKGLQKGREEGRQEGREEGHKEGELAGTRKTAQNMLSHGFPIDQIVNITGLCEEEIRSLQKVSQK